MMFERFIRQWYPCLKHLLLNMPPSYLGGFFWSGIDTNLKSRAVLPVQCSSIPVARSGMQRRHE